MARRVTAVLVLLLMASAAFAAEPVPTPRWVGIFPLKDRIGLKWIDVPKVATYIVQRKKAGDIAWTAAATVKLSSWVDQDVVVGVYYHYRIVAVDRDGRKSDPSDERYARLQQAGKDSVGEPDWVGILVRTGGVGLKWAPGDGAPPVVYNVYRKKEGDESFALIGSSDSTGFLDEKVAVGETYIYVVKAIGSDFLEGPASSERRVYFLPVVPTPEAAARPFPTEPRTLPKSDRLEFRSPTDAAFDYRGILYVSDTDHDRVVAIDPARGFLREIGGSTLQRPMGIGIAPDGSLAVAEARTSTVRIYDREGGFVRSIDCRRFGKGEECGLADAAWDPATGNLAIVDNLNTRIFVVGRDGTLRYIAGRRGSSTGLLLAPGLAVYGPKGELFVVDQLRSAVLVYGQDGEFLREFGARTRSYGGFGRPKGIAFDGGGRVYVTDGLLNSVQVFLATGQPLGFLADKDGEPVDLVTPTGIAVGQGNEVILVEKLVDRLRYLVVTDVGRLEQAGRDAALRSTGRIAPAASPAAVPPQPGATATPAPAVRPVLPLRPIGPVPVGTPAGP